jgi:hypothetical protein
MNNFITLLNDYYGNPRYYIGRIELANILKCNTDQLDEWAYALPIKKYTGKKYGYGYVLNSYNIEEDLTACREIIAKFQALNKNYPDRLWYYHKGLICEKVGRFYKPYSDQANNIFNGLDLSIDL